MRTEIAATADYRTEFQTPREVARYMTSLVPPEARTILEPTPGIGNIIRELRRAGYTDITAPADFFLLDRKKRYDAIVMNPPFAHKYAIMDNAPDRFKVKGMRLGYQMLIECMQRSDNVIALMPWFTLSDSDVRLRALKRWGIKSLTALPRKTFEYARIQTVVIELKKNWHAPTVFKVYDLIKSDTKQQLQLNF